MDQEHIDRFWSRVDRSGDCWEWRGTRFANGYGAFWDGRKTRKAHRIMYELVHGPLDDKLVRHSCDNPPCCNPAHLLKGTHADNMGERNPNAKLDWAKVRRIRQVYANSCTTMTKRLLAAEYGVTTTAITKIVRGDLWREPSAELRT